MNIFQQAGDMIKLRKQAAEMQKKLAATTVEVEENGIKVVIGGDQQIKEFIVEGVASQDAVKVLNQAIKKSQEAAAAAMKENMGDLSALLGGLSGK